MIIESVNTFCEYVQNMLTLLHRLYVRVAVELLVYVMSAALFAVLM